MSKSLSISVLLLIAVLAGCTVGPKYTRPNVPVPDHFSTASQGVTADPGNPEFWRSFDDPQLTKLVDQALAANNDLRAAMTRLDSAAALLRQAKLDRYPIVTAGATGGQQKVSKSQAFGFPSGSQFFNGSINASWELDFFGRVRRSIESQQAQTAATANDIAAIQIAIVGEVVTSYIDLRGQQDRLRIARENAENERETLRLVEARLAAGRDTEFDLARARSQVESTLARIPDLLTIIAVDQHRLAVLCGRTPDAFISELDPVKPIPALPADIAPGTPASLVRRRPDIAAAEERLHAATARVGVATADLFPRINFGGMFGLAEFHSGSSFDGVSPAGLAAANIDWSFLDRGRVRARIAASQADAEGQLLQYQQTVLLALEDVENSLVTYQRNKEREARLEQAAKDSAQAAGLARTRFDAGATGLLDLLDAQRVQLQSEDALAASRLNSGTTAAALYKALAGGWPQRMPPKP